MEGDNHNTERVYLQLLIDAMGKKMAILGRLIEVTGEQEALMEAENFDDDGFLHTISVKEDQLAELEAVDQGFDRVFELVKEEVLENRFKYEVQIKALQGYITAITDKSVKLQAMELRNKAKMETLLANKRKELRRSRVSTQSVSKYYRSMTNHAEEQSFFYDKKK